MYPKFSFGFADCTSRHLRDSLFHVQNKHNILPYDLVFLVKMRLGYIAQSITLSPTADSGHSLRASF